MPNAPNIPAAPNTPAAIEVEALTKVFTTEDGVSVPVLDSLDLRVDEGSFVTLLGPTGCGKTTLLRILVGLESATRGTARVSGRAPLAGRVPAGVVFQQNSLLPWRRVLSNVTFPLEMKGVRRRVARERAHDLLRLVGLEHAARAYPYELSGGMQQRAAMARALAYDARILLMDEPFGALDDQTRRTLQGTMLDLWRARHLTVLFITHNIEEALLLGDRVVVLGHGRVLEDQRVALPRPRDPLNTAFTDQLLALRRIFVRAVNGRTW